MQPDFIYRLVVLQEQVGVRNTGTSQADEERSEWPGLVGQLHPPHEESSGEISTPDSRVEYYHLPCDVDDTESSCHVCWRDDAVKAGADEGAAANGGDDVADRLRKHPVGTSESLG